MGLHLHVSITVPKEDEQAFSDQLKIVLREKALGDWKLEGGFRVIGEMDPAQFDGGRPRARDGEIEFVNVWRLPEGAGSSDVAATMVRLSELESYIKLDAKVHTEAQEIVYRINAPRDEAAWEVVKQAKGGAVARVRHYPFRSNISALVFTLGAISTEWEAKKGWTFLGMFQNITGLLNEFWAYWYLPTYDGVKQVNQELAELARQTDTLTTDLLASTHAKAPIWTPQGRVDDAAVSIHDGLTLLTPAEYWRSDR